MPVSGSGVCKQGMKQIASTSLERWLLFYGTARFCQVMTGLTDFQRLVERQLKLMKKRPSEYTRLPTERYNVTIIYHLASFYLTHLQKGSVRADKDDTERSARCSPDRYPLAGWKRTIHRPLSTQQKYDPPS